MHGATVKKLASLSFRTERAKPKMKPNDCVSTNWWGSNRIAEQ